MLFLKVLHWVLFGKHHFLRPLFVAINLKVSLMQLMNSIEFISLLLRISLPPCRPAGTFEITISFIATSTSRALSTAYEFMKEFKEGIEHFIMLWKCSSAKWKAPSLGMIKVNFDASKLRSWGKGWEVVGRNSPGCIVFTAAK